MSKTSLIIPKDQAKKQIEAQIEKGKRMMSSKLRNKGELRALDDAEERWTDYNIQLCRELFSDDSIAREIMRYKSRLYQDWTFKEEIRYFRERIREQLNNLISINERIEIMTVRERAAEVAEQPKTGAKEGSVSQLIKANRHWLFEGIGTQTVQWIGSGLVILAIFVGGYIWTKRPADSAQQASSPSPPDSQTPTTTPTANSTPVVSSTPIASPVTAPSLSAAVGPSPYDPNQIVSSVDPALWPQLIGTWNHKWRNQKTGEFEPAPFNVQFYSEGGLLKCKLIMPPNPRIPEKTCTKLIIDGSRILFSFGGSDYTGRLELKRQFMEGKIISYGDNEYRGDWTLTR